MEYIYFLFFFILSGCLSSVETALFALAPEELLSFKSGSYQRRLIFKLMQSPEKLLTVLLVSNNFVNILIVSLGAFLIKDSLSSIEIFKTSFLLAFSQFLILTLIIFIFGEVFPKQIALKRPYKVAVFFIFPLVCLYILMSVTGIRRLILFLTSLLLLVSRKILGTKDVNVDVVSIQEGIALLEEKGSIANEESIVLHNLFRMQTTPIVEMMRHRSKVEVVSPLDEVDKILPNLLNLGHNQIPVYDNTKDQIIGIFNVRVALKKKQNDLIGDVMGKPYFIPMIFSLSGVFQLLQARDDNLRIVVNQFGEYEGILSSKMVVDFLSRSSQSVEKWEPQEMGTVLDATTPIKVVEQLLNTSFPKGDYHTVAGLVLEKINKIPVAGECVLLKGWKFFIEEVEENRILKISIQ